MRTAAVYTDALAMVSRGQLDWERDDIYAMLVTADYVPARDRSITTADQLRRYQPAPSGEYESGGKPLEGRKVTGAEWLCGEQTWARFEGRFRWRVAYLRDSGTLVLRSDLGPQSLREPRDVVIAGGVAARWETPVYVGSMA